MIGYCGTLKILEKEKKMLDYPFGLEDPFTKNGPFVEPTGFYKPEPHSSLSVHSYPITVDYSRSIKDMKKAGKYHDTCDIPSDSKYWAISPDKLGKVVEYQTALLFLGQKRIKSRLIVRAFQELGLILPQLPELLAFGELHPALQNQFPIVSLGAVLRQLFFSEWAAFLGGGGVARGVYTTSRYFQTWDDIPWRFLAILPKGFELNCLQTQKLLPIQFS